MWNKDCYIIQALDALTIYINLQIGEPKLSLSTKDYFFNAEHQNLRDAYLRYSTNIAILLGAEVDTANSDMKDVFDLDIQIANVSIWSTIHQYACT